MAPALGRAELEVSDTLVLRGPAVRGAGVGVYLGTAESQPKIAVPAPSSIPVSYRSGRLDPSRDLPLLNQCIKNVRHDFRWHKNGVKSP
jgi:hypothetical protein